jgi:bacterioferritin
MKQPVTQVSPELLAMLNEGIALELQVSIQYMMQHIQWSGIKGFAVQNELKSIAMSEMKHAESIAERLFYLGGIPTVTPAPITVSMELLEMLNDNVAAEAATVDLYKRIIVQAVSESDEATAQIFRGILVDEESHHDTFMTLLETYDQEAIIWQQQQE